MFVSVSALNVFPVYHNYRREIKAFKKFSQPFLNDIAAQRKIKGQLVYTSFISSLGKLLTIKLAIKISFSSRKGRSFH